VGMNIEVITEDRHANSVIVCFILNIKVSQSIEAKEYRMRLPR